MSRARTLRIAFLDSWLQGAAEGSGTAVAIDGLGAALRRRGHVVQRITLAQHTRSNWLPLTLRRLHFNRTLGQRLRAGDYDLVVGFDIDGVWLPARHAQPYLCSIKGIIAEELRHERGRVRLLFQLLARLERANARSADRVLCTSRYARERIVAHYGVPAARIGIVPEGIDLASWRMALRSAPPRIDRRPTILCVARQYPRKHVADLLRAFALLRRHLPEARLRLVGDGPEHARLRALAHELRIEQAVSLLGAIPDEAVRHEYAHADLFCLPSAQEGFGIVFLEAMAAGLPIVAGNATAIPEVVHHGECGILVPPGDLQAIAGALLRLLGDAELRAWYGQAGQRIVAQYDWERVAGRFLDEVAKIQPQEA